MDLARFQDGMIPRQRRSMNESMICGLPGRCGVRSRDGNSAGMVAAISGYGHGDVVPVEWFVRAWHHKSDISDIPDCPELTSGDNVLHMTGIGIPPDFPRRPLKPGETLQKCMKAIRRTHPDYESAEVYATLSLNETLRNVAA